jgi:hypothetical protein
MAGTLGELVRERVLAGIRLEAVPLKTIRRGSIVERAKARLMACALCRHPAFKQAQVLAVRDHAR